MSLPSHPLPRLCDEIQPTYLFCLEACRRTLDLCLAVGHHLLIFVLFGVLAAELVLVQSGIDQPAIGRIARIDLWYGVLAGLIVIVGFTRAIFAAKGWPYYEHNLYFWLKITTFFHDRHSIGASDNSIHTLAAWRTGADLPQVSAVRRFLWIEVALFALLPIFAAAMARGFGEYPF